MYAIATQLPVLVTASARGHELGRELTGRGLSLVGATGSLAQLRRSLVRGSLNAPVVLCITLDDPTLRRHGAALMSILDDRGSFTTPVRAIGMIFDATPARGWQGLGCDALTNRPADVADLLDEFEQSWTSVPRFSDRFALNDLRRAETRHAELRQLRPSRRRRR